MNGFTDSFGAPTSANGEELDAINAFVEGFIAYQPRAVEVLDAAEQAPDCALLNLYAACLWMFLERPEAPDKAAPFLQRANSARYCNTRERALLSVLQAWQKYDFCTAADRAEAMLERWPEDLATLKIAQYHRFNTADAPGMLRMALKVRKVNDRRAPFHSMLAFGHEQCHHIDAAERAAHRALEIDASEPWAHHALAHVHLTRGSIAEGKRFMDEMSMHWTSLNSFMFTHNWWHLALFEIAEGRVKRALDIHDERCWGIEPDYSQDQIGAVSLLARLECAGVDVGDRWRILRPFLETRADDVVQPFLTLQYLYGLARAESPAADLLMTRIEEQREQPVVAYDRLLWQDIGIPAAEGMLAHAAGRYRECADRLASVQTRLWRIGGSHAQRDLFEQLLLDALLKSEQWCAAQQLLEMRRRWEPDNPLLMQRLTAVYGHLGLRSVSP